MAPTKLIIDCDPGIDDAVALLLALASPEADVLAVTTVAGNVALEHTTANACRLLDLAGRSDVPVHAGCPRPMLRPLLTVPHVHGDTGLAGAGLPDPVTRPRDGHAVAALRELIAAAPGEITLVAIGPLTNVALALIERPELAREVREIVVMGGVEARGNTTAYAEFNFRVDPAAARVVLGSGARVTMLGLDVTRRVRADAEWLDRIEALGTPVGRVVAGMLRRYAKGGGAGLHDPLAVGHVLWPDLTRVAPARVDIVVEEGERAGQSLVARGSRDDANATVIDPADGEASMARLAERLARYA